MNVLGMDIGGKTRNGFCLMNDKEVVLETSFIIYDNKQTPLAHRSRILYEAKRYIENYKVDYLVFERINLFRGKGVSPLANIISLCKLQTTLIDNLSDKVIISDIAVRTWKSKILGNGNATKEDSIQFVLKKYPNIDIKLPKYKRKDPDAFIYNHDLCDAIAIAAACCKYPEDLLKNKVNYL